MEAAFTVSSDKAAKDDDTKDRDAKDHNAQPETPSDPLSGLYLMPDLEPSSANLLPATNQLTTTAVPPNCTPTTTAPAMQPNFTPDGPQPIYAAEHLVYAAMSPLLAAPASPHYGNYTQAITNPSPVQTAMQLNYATANNLPQAHNPSPVQTTTQPNYAVNILPQAHHYAAVNPIHIYAAANPSSQTANYTAMHPVTASSNHATGINYPATGFQYNSQVHCDTSNAYSNNAHFAAVEPYHVQSGFGQSTTDSPLVAHQVQSWHSDQVVDPIPNTHPDTPKPHDMTSQALMHSPEPIITGPHHPSWNFNGTANPTLTVGQTDPNTLNPNPGNTNTTPPGLTIPQPLLEAEVSADALLLLRSGVLPPDQSIMASSKSTVTETDQPPTQHPDPTPSTVLKDPSHLADVPVVSTTSEPVTQTDPPITVVLTSSEPTVTPTDPPRAQDPSPTLLTALKDLSRPVDVPEVPSLQLTPASPVKGQSTYTARGVTSIVPPELPTTPL